MKNLIFGVIALAFMGCGNKSVSPDVSNGTITCTIDGQAWTSRYADALTIKGKIAVSSHFWNI
jgi:hypothetical protein